MSCDCSRRNVLRSLVGGSLLLPGMLHELLAGEGAVAAPIDELAPKAPHFPAKAKRVIMLYMSGGVSHVDSFDYKKKLFDDAGKQVPSSNPHRKSTQFLKRPDFEFKPHGKSGMMISELFPNIAECADDICMLNSLKCDHGNHYEATLQVHTGSFSFVRPSIGSWVSYGLGTVNKNLPSFIALAPFLPYAGGQTWGNDFLPGCHQGVRVQGGAQAIPNMNRRALTAGLQDMELGLLNAFNESHLSTRGADPALAARVKSFETAFGMQKEAPEAFDFSKESDATHKLYGLERGSTAGFAWQCLAARRLCERGVRFIELIDTGAHDNWDSHDNMKAHIPLARNVDKPIAGLLQDLKARGMLDDTLVVWTTEFGRTPQVGFKENKGREHHPSCFTSWMAGAGVKRGYVHGKSDDYGIEVGENGVHMHDFHATILHLLGINHEKLTFRHAGRDFRLTDVAGKVVKEILS